jgi:hypothetical protein
MPNQNLNTKKKPRNPNNKQKPKNQNNKKKSDEDVKSITVLKKKRIDGAYWRGSQVDIILGIYFLKNKYNSIQIFGDAQLNTEYTFNQIIQNTNLYFDFDTGILTFPMGFNAKVNELLEDNSQKRFGILPIFVVGKQFEHAHANMLIMDFKRKEFDRFEPYGFTTEDTKLDTALRKYFKEINGSIKYYKPSSNEDFQDLEEDQISMKVKTARAISDDPGGYCAAWSIWYAEMRVMNPNLSRASLTKLIKKKFKNLENSYRTFIRNYANFLHMERKKTLKNKGLGSKRSRFSRMTQIRDLLS